MTKSGVPHVLIYITSAMLFIAIAPLPYSYFTLLRIVVCSVFVLAFLVAYDRNYKNLIWVYALIAIIFNPFIKIHFDREIWMFIDVIASIIMIVTANKIVKKADN